MALINFKTLQGSISKALQYFAKTHYLITISILDFINVINYPYLFFGTIQNIKAIMSYVNS
jgi:hypothetical protein